MSLIEKLNSDMQAALKAGQTERLSTLRLINSAAANEKIKVGHDLSDDEATKVLQREAKQRRDSAEQFRQAGRQELADKEEAELAVISEYLPQAMPEDELARLVNLAIGELGSDAQMGAVIGAVMAKAGARADGGTVSRLVRERLAGS